MRLVKLRKCAATLGLFLCIFACIILYRMADRTFRQSSVKTDQIKNEWIRVKDVSKEFPVDNAHRGKLISIKTEQINHLKCNKISYGVSADINMLDVYRDVKFDNPDGGVWKQGWNVQSHPDRWSSERKLKVFVVPHSHNDPGWVKTFEDYFNSQTRNILNNLVSKMSSDPAKRFIWAEISYLARWWDSVSQQQQDQLKRLIENGQLEIVTGGWVMNDEANSHYFAILTQLTEGHLWMKNHLNVLPKTSWCIDPFGKSATQPFILKKMGLENLVIQRVHYSIKKYFAQKKLLEFRWRQMWDASGGETELLTHMMPFYSYDVPHTCGPDPKICCQFDFKRLPGHGLSCPWKEPPKMINNKNVAARAQLLLDQYRKKAELYRTNVVLAPLGDDFRYEQATEWDNQFDNYYKIFEYFNNHPELNVEARFGTLQEFFAALMEESAVEEFPSLHGDFFTYADRDDHYWSGYFTSRPFHKRIDRILIGYIRAAEILYVLSWSSNPRERSNWLLAPQSGFAKMLRDSRRSLSLFQHHDAVTGTARDHVMEDYARKMLEALSSTQHVIQQCVHFLLSSPDLGYQPEAEQIYFDFDDHRRNQNSLPERKLLIFRHGESKRIVIFNSLTFRRREIVSVLVFSRTVSVRNSDGEEIPAQTNPIFSHGSIMDESRYEVFFLADVPALGLASYTITMHPTMDEIQKNTMSKVRIFNSFGTVKFSPGFLDTTREEPTEFSIDSDRIKAVFTNQGRLKVVTIKDRGLVESVHLDFVRYKARGGEERSGAYLFLPGGEAQPLRAEAPLIRIINGPLVSRMELLLPQCRHMVSVYNSPGVDGQSVEIANLVDITQEENYELAMRLITRVRSGEAFFTDLNGYQMIERQRFAKLPIQGNFYPMSAAAYIEDDRRRISLLTGQPLGVTSLAEGQLEVVQDRRLQQDDHRGLGQGVLDNRPTLNVFRLMVEEKVCKSSGPRLSPSSHNTAQILLNPFFRLLWQPETPCDLDNSFSPGDSSFSLPEDVVLISSRTLNEEKSPEAGFVWHRTTLDVCWTSGGDQMDLKENITINMETILPERFGDVAIKTMSLSFLREEETWKSNQELPLCTMDFLSVSMKR